MEKLWAFFAMSVRHVTCQDVFGSIKISMPDLPAAFAVLAVRATQTMVYMNTLVQSMVKSCSMHQEATENYECRSLQTNRNSCTDLIN
jgi:hypothetical protein